MDGRGDCLCVWVWCGPHLSVCLSPLYAADVRDYVSRLLSRDGSQGCQVDDTPMRGLMTSGLLWEDLSLGDKGGFRESLSLHLLFSKCLQLKIINIPKWRILGCHVLNPCWYICGQHILNPYTHILG